MHGASRARKFGDGAVLRIGLLVERQRAYGRRVCEGAAAYALAHPGISLGMLEWDDLFSVSALEGYDAFIVRVLDDRMEKALRRTGKPVVDIFYGRTRDGFAVADLDNSAIANLAAEHFLQRGFRSFAYCGYEGVRFSDDRRSAFVRRVESEGFRCQVFPTPRLVIERFADAVVRSEVFSMTRGESRLLKRWLDALPHATAVFCSHDLRAHQVLELCRSAGISVPRRLAILGVDDDAILCGFTSPTLTSIDPDGSETGRAAVRLAVDLVSGRKASRCLVPPKGLIARGSTEIYPGGPAWLSDALVFSHQTASRGIGPSDVFAYVGLSHTTVGKVFRRVRGMTVQDEITRSRLESACRLLLTTEFSVTEIARGTGFASPQYFCRAFASAHGVAPGEWRRRQNG